MDEDLDSLLANVEYIQSNIVELQNDLIAMDDSKVIGTLSLKSTLTMEPAEKDVSNPRHSVSVHYGSTPSVLLTELLRQLSWLG